MFRRSCGKCHYCNTHRPSDITLADFWGWQRTAPEINKDDKGVSLVLVNTEKGRELFDKVKDRLIIVSAQLEKCMQPNLKHPSAIHPLRNEFERDYIEKGMGYVMSHNYDKGMRYNLVEIFRKIAKVKEKYKRKALKLFRIITTMK